MEGDCKGRTTLFDLKSHGHILATNVTKGRDELVTFTQLDAQNPQRIFACFFDVSFNLVTALQNGELAGDTFGGHRFTMIHEVNYCAVGLCDQLKAHVIDLLHDAAILGLDVAMGQGWIHA